MDVQSPSVYEGVHSWQAKLRERESEDLERAELHSYETVRILFLFHKVLPLDKNYLTACAKYIKCTV